MKVTNRLAKESSPYLLQHQHNPVDWYPWSEEALLRSKEEDKPILVSIGYSSCHWCHVMERESFEDGATAEIMNRHFINIKIDREERPDLDHIYMDAVQAMTGSGGWPLNVFLTPELKPFYGGTYFPPVRAYNRASWKEILHGIAESFKKRRDEIEEQAMQLTAHMQNANSFGTEKMVSFHLPAEDLFAFKQVHDAFDALMKQADKEWGGFGNAPKFPQTFAIRFLLQYYHFTKNQEALQFTRLCLDRMIMGGIYDHIGGGFCRYSTDAEWLAPHFEKMLYDNALLLIALSDAFQITADPLYKKTIEETLDFIEREMTSPEGGFYSALDADSEGVEGKYYTWSKKEVNEILDTDAQLFNELYDITEAGNWEHINIPRLLKSYEAFSSEHQLDINDLTEWAAGCKNKLLEHRFKRIRPQLDDKILLGWNALMNQAYSKAFVATGHEPYRKKAIENMDLLLRIFPSFDFKSLLHTYKNGSAKYTAFLDDYACLIQALLQLQEITSDPFYLQKAKEFTEIVQEQFVEPSSGFFYFTPEGEKNILIRKKEVYDGATPSGNAVMAMNLHYLGLVFNNTQWQQQSIRLTGALLDAIIRYPLSFGVWLIHLSNLVQGVLEVAVVGNGFEKARDEINRLYIPNKIIQSANVENNKFPLLKGKKYQGETLRFFLCKNYSCLAPTSNIDEFIDILRKQALKTIK
jgi:uncharacterized protein YyaL (SSP411 family)